MVAAAIVIFYVSEVKRQYARLQDTTYVGALRVLSLKKDIRRKAAQRFFSLKKAQYGTKKMQK